jgi:hypothetical protein
VGTLSKSPQWAHLSTAKDQPTGVKGALSGAGLGFHFSKAVKLSFTEITVYFVSNLQFCCGCIAVYES